ncbi:hypothetical protein ACIQ4Z_07855 [Peribacillus asahii]|uniref:hypothetical protein n=1 Tax=Peribacillus asahii TaxID=228899 RepID=UPI00381A80CB
MYVGFKLDYKEDNYFAENKEKGLPIYEKFKHQVKQQLDSFLSPEGSLDGTKMREDWFPLVEADIFISHSHNDEEKAIALAGWLFEEFNLTAFIDSCVWGYAGDLLKKIDKEYCWNEQSNTYDYLMRNYSTSHVHMMLASALTMMMDKTECIFFLNSPSAIKTSDISSKTASPWIYHELTMTHLIQKKSPEQHRKLLSKGMQHKNFAESKQLNITYDVNLSNLINLTYYDLLSWTVLTAASNMEHPNLLIHPLDVLYKQKKAIKQPIGGILLNE